MNTELLKELAQLNEKAQKVKYETSTSPLMGFNHIDTRENGIVDSLEQLKAASVKMLSVQDMKGLEKPEDLFEVLIKKVNEKITQEAQMSKELLNDRIRRIELIDRLSSESDVNPNLNFVKIRNFQNNHKAIEAFQTLERIYRF